MSYCRMSDGDVYLFPNTDGVIECMGCHLAPKVRTKFTVGDKYFGIEPCKHCDGKGCVHCMMHGCSTFANATDAINHVKAHIKAGDHVPDYVIPEIEADIKDFGTDDVSKWDWRK